MYKPRDIVELVANNVRKTGNPFGTPRFVINRWWKKTAALPQVGDSLLFTGFMYQSVPYIEKLTAYLERYENTTLANYIRYGRFIPAYLAGLGLACMASKKEKKRFNSMLHSIVEVLQKSSIDFFYRPELDHYSGVLLYDLGDLEGFVAHAKSVSSKLRENGVEKVITVDPHTTYALKELYPKYTGESFEVKTYFELVNFKGNNGVGRVTLHDPCMYGRYLEMAEVPMKVLENLGVECVQVRNSGPFTNCCGGPAESVSPKLSRELVDRRIEELQSTGAPIVAMCPICMANLTKGGIEVEDLSSLLARCA